MRPKLEHTSMLKHNRLRYTLCLKTTLLMLHTLYFNTHKPISVIFGRDVTREYAIKWWFIVPPLLNNVSSSPREIWTWTPEIVSFQSCCIPCLENDTALACYIFDIQQPILIIFVDNKVVLLSTVCKYFLPSHFVFETQYRGLQHDWKDTISGVHVSPPVQRHYS